MSIQDSTYHVKGSLYINPTGVSASSVYGTLIAYTEDGYAVKPRIQTVEDKVPEYADETINVRDLGDSPVVLFAAKTFNYTVAQAIAGNRAGTTGTDAVAYMDFPSTVVAGSSLPTARYLFVPEDTTQPFAFIAHRGQMIMPYDDEIKFKLADPTVFPLILHCTRAAATSSSSVYNYRKLRISRIDKLSVDTSLT